MGLSWFIKDAEITADSFFHYLPNNLPTTDFFSSGAGVPPKAFAISVAMSAADACGCETEGADEPAGLFSTYVLTIL